MFKNLLTATFLLVQTTLPAQSPCTTTPPIPVFRANNLSWIGLGFGSVGETYVDHSFLHGYNGAELPPSGFITSDLWVGGIDPGGNLKLVHGNSGLDFWENYAPGPLDAGGVFDPLNCGQWNRIWEASRHEIEAHRADFLDNGQLDAPLDGIVGWPGAGNPNFETIHGFPLPAGAGPLAPFFDQNNDGVYNAYDGDYPHPAGLDPAVTVGEIAWAAYNGSPSGLQMDFHTTTWALACDDNDVLNNAIFQTFHLTNRSAEPLDSTVLGLRDYVLNGSYEDDFVGANPALNSVFVYNADNTDGPLEPVNFGENPPATALTVLSHPLYKSIYYNWSNNTVPPAIASPATPGEYYNYLNGHWRDNTPLSEGGTGYNPGNPAAPAADFAFPGDPADPGSWAMTNAAQLPGLRAAVSSVFLGNIPPGASRTVVTAHSFHRGAGLNHLENVAYLNGRVAQLHQQYALGFDDACSYVPCVTDCVWPGDTNRDGIVDHNDLLPFGTIWADTGLVRGGFNTWAPHDAPDWGQLFDQNYDLKHLDPNGDGTGNEADVTLMRDFYGFHTPWWSPAPDEFPVGDNFTWTTLPPSVNPDSIVAGQVVLITARYDSLLAVRGAALQIDWDTAYWQVLVATGAASGAGFQGIFRRYDTEADYARTLLAPEDAFRDGSWVFLQLRAKTIAPSQPAATLIRLKNIRGIAADGSALPLGSQPLEFHFAGGASSTEAPAGAGAVRVFPNPAHTDLNIAAAAEKLQEAVFFDAAGRRLAAVRLNGTGYAALPVGHLPRGLAFVQVRTGGAVFVKKLLLEN